MTRQAGFSIIEVLLGISILLVGILALGTMQLTAVQVNARARDITEATTLAQDKIEELLGISYDGLDADASPVNDPRGYLVTWTVTNDSPVPNTKQIRVVVDWTGIGGDKSVEMTTVRARLTE